MLLKKRVYCHFEINENNLTPEVMVTVMVTYTGLWVSLEMKFLVKQYKLLKLTLLIPKKNWFRTYWNSFLSFVYILRLGTIFSWKIRDILWMFLLQNKKISSLNFFCLNFKGVKSFEKQIFKNSIKSKFNLSLKQTTRYRYWNFDIKNKRWLCK